MIILPNFYFGPISYFRLWLKSQDCYIEKYENFPKQTYRNRCIIQGANGHLPLIIPTEHNGKRLFKDIKISYASNWQKLHWKSLQSSYQSSPYFEFYESGLQPIYEKKESFLFDFNLKTLAWLSAQLKLGLSYDFTKEYHSYPEQEDARNLFNAKEESKYLNTKYTQVFSDRFNFMNDLSIFDLLFNIGPKSLNYININ